MPDSRLDDRLYADARRAIAAPDLDASLDAVRSVQAHAPVRPTGRWLAAAASVAVVAGGAVALWATHGSTDGHTHPAASQPVPAHSFDSRIAGVVLLPGDPSGRSLKIYATAPAKRMKSGYGCVDDANLTVRQTSDSVLLHSTARLRSNGVIACESAAFQDPRTGVYAAGLGIDLRKPLGNRTVRDESTGDVVTVFRPQVAHAGYLPHGYGPAYGGSALRSTDYWYDERPGFLAPIAVATVFAAQGDAHRAPQLDVINAPTTTTMSGGTLLEHVKIDGHDATVVDSPHARCVTWSPDGTTGRQVCSNSAIINPLGDYQKHVVQLDVDELVEVARNLS